VFNALVDRAPQFKGRQQHDSHELLRVLLDGLEVRTPPPSTLLQHPRQWRALLQHS
jgi:hypothetical protein